MKEKLSMLCTNDINVSLSTPNCLSWCMNSAHASLSLYIWTVYEWVSLLSSALKSKITSSVFMVYDWGALTVDTNKPTLHRLLEWSLISKLHHTCSLLIWLTVTCACVCAQVPVGRPAGTHTAAASGVIGPFCAAKCSPGAADGAKLHARHPECSEPAT